jgi:glycosyltransferase involved in cell wall biosynthesis
MSRIGVVIPVHNRPGMVRDALDRVVAQTLAPFRVVVVDDGSTDHTAAAVESWVRHHSGAPVELVRQPHGGAAAARNRGLDLLSDCPLVAFLDSDDLWPASFLDRALSALVGRDDAVAATSDRVVIDHEKRTVVNKSSVNLARDAVLHFLQKGADVTSATLFPSHVVRRLGGYPEEVPTGHDSALFLRLGLEGRWLHVPGEAVVIRRALGPLRGEEGRIGARFTDSQRRWMEIREDFLARFSHRLQVEPEAYSSGIAGQWRLAGRQLRQAGLIDEAEQCFRSSREWLADPRLSLSRLRERSARASG